MTAVASLPAACLAPLYRKACVLLAEGVHPARIEMAALKAGMPVGPLAIQDEVSLTLSEHVANETYKALEAQGQDHHLNHLRMR